MTLIALVAAVFALPSFLLFNAGSTTSHAGSATRVPRTALAPAAAPLLMISKTQPLTIAGRKFVPGERVRVKANAKSKTVSADTRGSFSVRFPGVDPCTATVTARGSAGSRVSLQFSQLVCLDG